MEVTLEDAKNDLNNFLDELVFINYLSPHNAEFYKGRIKMLFDASQVNP